jgi:hypothetical protein
MSAGNLSQIRRRAQPCENRKLLDIVFVSPAGFGIGDVGQPFQFGRHVGQVAKLGDG